MLIGAPATPPRATFRRSRQPQQCQVSLHRATYVAADGLIDTQVPVVPTTSTTVAAEAASSVASAVASKPTTMYGM